MTIAMRMSSVWSGDLIYNSNKSLYIIRANNYITFNPWRVKLKYWTR